ncbi:hypothetical protein LCGC14_0536790 [marine sediment metagenome]|uniref:PglD N-terminal domain-containing protein n=1 Tax=marine sediment metagenome TaxID=412755 RepID=A0A0F9RYL7_9ZZZZ
MLTDRQKFCLERRDNWKPSINIEIPEFVRLGKNCHIEKNVVFALHGLGAEFIDDQWMLIPHNGTIEIGDNVTILDSTIIMRATKEATKIGSGSILGVKSHIGHNVQIGKNCLIGSSALLGGSSKIGENTYIGVGALIKNKIIIGKKCTIGMGAIVTKNVPDGETWAGVPANKIN